MAITVRNKSGTENIFLRNTMHRQAHKGRKPIVIFFKKLRNLLESGFSTCQISPHWTWSTVKPEKAKTLNILGYNI